MNSLKYSTYENTQTTHVNVSIDRTRRHDFPLSSNHFSVDPNDHLIGDARLDVWVTSFSDSRDPAIFDAQVCLFFQVSKTQTKLVFNLAIGI